jgi:nitrate/nitrite transporter NarK
MAMREVDKLKEFYQHALTYAFVIPMLWLINWYSSAEYWWAIWPTLGWGIGLASHAIGTFNIIKLFGPEWERREIQKRLNNRR